MFSRTRKEIEANAKRRRDRKKRYGKNEAEGELKITALLSMLLYTNDTVKWATLGHRAMSINKC